MFTDFMPARAPDPLRPSAVASRDHDPALFAAPERKAGRGQLELAKPDSRTVPA